MDVYVVGYNLEQNIMKFKANSSSAPPPLPTPSEIKYEAARKRAIFPWVDLLEVASLSPIQFESGADLFDNSPQDPWRTAVQSPLV